MALDEIKAGMMFRRFGPGNHILEDISRVEILVRERFGIEESEIVLVSEDPGTQPGFPTHETNMIFWKGEKRYRLKIFAPVSTVMDGDLPIGWLLPALEDNGDADCC
jgi:hypothetical protein